MAPWPVFVVAGVAIGALTGLFGVGGSSIATPLLAVLGVPGLLAVASPLPATIPAALGAAGPYIRNREARPRAAAWTLLGALPAAIAGALLSDAVGGPTLLIASGVVLVIVGQRVLQPIERSARRAGTVRRKNRLLLVAASAGVGLFTGLLANGGGFLLVPMYLLVFGLTMRESAGTSLLVIAILAVPDARHALGTRSHRLDGGRGFRTRRDTCQLREQPVGSPHRRSASPPRVRLVPHRLGHRLRPFPAPRSLRDDDVGDVSSSLVQLSPRRRQPRSRRRVDLRAGAACAARSGIPAPRRERLDHTRVVVGWSSRSLDPGSGRRGDRPVEPRTIGNAAPDPGEGWPPSFERPLSIRASPDLHWRAGARDRSSDPFRKRLGRCGGIALVVWLAIKARWEERHLRARYAGYASYASRTPRFIPSWRLGRPR